LETFEDVMSGTKSRQEERTSVDRVELVTVFRDQKDRPYEKLLKRKEELSSIHTVFSVVALVRDISQEGLGIKFEGQQMMAANLLRPGENYIVKLTVVLSENPDETMREYIRREGNYFFLLLKMTCRWHESTQKISTAGFELRSNNPPELVEFVREHFGLDK
jgi:hypothetical protein